MKGTFYGIAIEGWPIVLLALAATAWLAASSAPAAALLPALVIVFAIMKFRDPHRETFSDPLGVLSPVDGVVAEVDTTPTGTRVLLRIAMFSPYLWRSPTEGKVIEPGPENGGRGLRIRTDEGDEVGLRLRGPRWFPSDAVVEYGARVGQGQRCGVLRTARRVEMWLPPGAVIAVQRGERVRAGETALAHFQGENAAE